MSINGRQFQSKTAQRRANAEYFAASMGGTAEDWMDKSKPRHRIYDGIWLEQKGYRFALAYDYMVPKGEGRKKDELLYQVCRFEHKILGGHKLFAMRRPTGDYLVDEWFADAGEIKIIYRWPDVAAAKPKEVIYVTEGEKDCDRLYEQGLVATTVAGQHWSQTAAAALTGRDVVILEDNDEAGRDNAIESADWLQRYAKSIKIVRLPELGEGQDVSDWLDAGHKIRELKKIADETPRWGELTPLPDLDPKAIPPRGWLYGRYYVRQIVSLTIAPGAASKSALLITEALAMATGKNLLAIKKPNRQPLRVMYWNGEDALDELHRRVAAAKKHFGIDHAALGNRMFVQSGLTHPILLGESDGRKMRLNDPAIRKLRDTLRRDVIDVLILDPFINIHNVEENNNTAIDRVVKTLSRIAMECNCAIMIAHHSRKPGSREGNRTTVVEDGRGAIALRDAVRAARVLNRMTDNEISLAMIEQSRGGWYRRIDDGKANLMPPAELAEWFKMASVDLDNAPEWGEGDDIGVAAQWDFPAQKPLAQSPGDITRALDAVRAGGPWRRQIQVKPEIWIGTPIARALGHDPNNKATRTRMNKLVGEWITAGRLKLVIKETRRGTRGAEAQEFVEVAPPAPGSANSGEPIGGAPHSS